MNVFDYAMKMEMDGKSLYEKMADESNMDGLKNIFRRLAKDEQKHYEIFQAMKGQTSTMAMEDTTVLDDSKNIFEELLGKKNALGPVSGDIDGYRHAMKLEADSFRLYEDAAEKEENKDVKALLLRIAGEEHKHFEVLENIYDFVNAPNQYLAWREFSNLDEFRNFGRDVDL
jgi:rubrerythrin